MLAVLDVRQSQDRVRRSRQEMYANYSRSSARIFLAAAQEHCIRRAAQAQMLIYILLAIATVAFVATVYNYVALNTASMLPLFVIAGSAVAMVALGCLQRRRDREGPNKLVDVINDAHRLNEARQRDA